MQENLSFPEFLKKLLNTTEFVQIQPEMLPEGIRDCAQDLNNISKVIRDLRLLSKESDKMLHQIANFMKRGIVILDKENAHILFNNMAFEKWMENYSLQGAVLMNDYLKEYQKEEHAQWEVQIECGANRRFLEIDSFQIDWNDRQGIVHMVYDITDKRERHIKTEQYAYRDALTGLYNRRSCYDFLADYLQSRESFCIGFADLDHLKYVNDHFGHKEGDFYIKSAAMILKKVFRKDDQIFRIGGDEFVIILKGCTEGTAVQRMESARKQLKEFYDNADTYRGISYGVVSVNKNHEYTPEAILEVADQKMYDYKKIHHM